MSNQYLTVAECAERYRISKSAVRKLMRKGRIPFIRIGDKVGRSIVRFSVSELEAFERTNSNTPAVK